MWRTTGEAAQVGFGRPHNMEVRSRLLLKKLWRDELCHQAVGEEQGRVWVDENEVNYKINFPIDWLSQKTV